MQCPLLCKINTSIEFYLQRVILKERLTLASFQNLYKISFETRRSKQSAKRKRSAESECTRVT